MKNSIEKTSIFLKKYWLYFIFGSITALSQAPLNYTLLSIIGFSAFFYLTIQHYNKVKIFWAGHMFGFGYFLFSLSWIGNALLTDTQQFGIFLPFAYFGLPFALAFFYAIAMWCYQKITDFFSLDTYSNKNIIIHLFVFSISLGFFDFLRGHIFTGFPWNLPVYTTVSISILMQPSFLFGIYFYNFIWIFLASSFGLYKFLNYTQIKKLILIHYIGISC